MSLPEGCTRIADRLRHYTPALAGLSRVLFDARSRPAVRMTATPAGGSQTRGAANARHFAHVARLRIGSTHGDFCVAVDVSRYAALRAISLEAEIELRVALANLWLAGPLEALSEHGISQAVVQDLSLDIEQHDDGSVTGALHFEYEHEGCIHKAMLLDASTALERQISLARVAHAALPASFADLASLTVPTCLRLRSRHCSAALLASLNAGDVLLGWPRAGGYAHGEPLEHTCLMWGAPTGRTAFAQARVDGRDIILQSIPAMTSHDFDLSLSPHFESSGVVPTASHPVDLNEVELPVHIEVVTVNLTLAQIAALQPGHILTLPLALADAEIRLVAHGQTLALGELVAVGDNLGLQIQHIARSNERHS
ncbi:type III secretion system cytoplasmic ring protein SctQ [Burkholderia cepacia]|uniref:type III secretion system cytoplasmic ring protein SctQ n=1 Tax=Burkholderia cepacia TaxID=292 RepID=UPI0009BCC92B|nr:type III secretion system cytoplasmic ring protein SctQ [Burkholderia cepacia]